VGRHHTIPPRTRPTRTQPRRLVHLPSKVEALRAPGAEQVKKRLREEPGWTGSDLVPAAPNGGPWWPSNFDCIWRRFKKRHGVACRFHDLRHTHATRLLKAGVHPMVVSGRLGHASIGIKLDTPSQVMPGMQE